MKIELQINLYRWLFSLGILHTVEKQNNNNKTVLLSQEESTNIYDGQYISTIIINLMNNDERNIEINKLLKMIKNNSTPAIRLYNWNILTQVLKKIQYHINYSQKSKILNLEQQPIINVIKYLYKYKKKQFKIEQKEIKENKIIIKQQKQKQILSIDINKLKTKTFLQSINIMQYIVLTISYYFKLSYQHTLNLFLDNNKYLSYLIVKGIKKQYFNINQWLQEILKSLEFIIIKLFFIEQKNSINFFLQILKSCLISKNQIITQNYLKIISKLISIYSQHQINFLNIYLWFKQNSINTFFLSIKRHFNLFQNIINISYQCIGKDLFQQIEKSQILWNNDKQKLIFYKNFLTFSSNKIIKQFSLTQYYNNWTKYCFKILKTISQCEQICSSIIIFQLIWIRIEQKLQISGRQISQLYLFWLKNQCISKNSLIYIQSIRSLFTLMQILANRKNQYAILIFHTLIELFSSATNTQQINFYSYNFLSSFKSITALPGHTIVQPLLSLLEKQITLPNVQLCCWLLNSQRINQNQSSLLIEMLTNIFLHNVTYSQMAIQGIISYIPKMQQIFQHQLVQKNSIICLCKFYSISKSLTRSKQDLISDYNRYQQEMKSTHKTFQHNINKYIILNNCLIFLNRIIRLNQQFKQQLKISIFNTYIKIKLELSQYNTAQIMLPLLRIYYQLDQDLFQNLLIIENQFYSSSSYITHNKLNEINLEKNQPSKLNIQLQIDTINVTTKKINSYLLKPNLTAIKDLEKLKKKKNQMEKLNLEKSRIKDKIQQQKSLNISEINSHRIIQFGKRNLNNFEYKCLYDFNSIKKQDNLNIINIIGINLLNLNEQQQEIYIKDVNQLMKKYHKIWRFLFIKYSNYKINGQSGIQQKINFIQIWKILKDYQINFIKKQQSQILVRNINQNIKRRNDLYNLTYLGFEEYIIQLCYYGYNKIGYAHLPLSKKIQLMLNQIKYITSQKGNSIDLFNNPQEVYFQQTQVIKQFNRNLQKDINYILPQGYKKISRIKIQYIYEINCLQKKQQQTNKKLNKNQIYIQILEILDTIIYKNQVLNFHIIETKGQQISKVIAKPILFQQLNQKMKHYKNGYMLPKKKINQNQNQNQKYKPIFSPKKHQFHPLINFSLGIKLGLANVDFKKKYIAEEVAYWIDDMLDSIENGRNTVQDKAKRKIINNALKNQKKSLDEIKIEKRKFEDKYKKRSQSIKVEAEKARQKMRQNQLEKKRMDISIRKLYKQKQKKELEKKLKEFEQVKQCLKKKKNEQESKVIIIHQEQKKHKIQYQKGVEEYFKKKKQNLEEQYIQLRLNKEMDQKKEQQKKQKQQQLQKKIYYENIKNQQQILTKILIKKQQYQQLWISNKIQNIFKKFRKQLIILFQLLLKYEKSKISITNENKIGINTFNFFLLKFKIVPFLIDKKIMIRILKTADKDQPGNVGFSFRIFQEILFKIIVKAKIILNKLTLKKNPSLKIELDQKYKYTDQQEPIESLENNNKLLQQSKNQVQKNNKSLQISKNSPKKSKRIKDLTEQYLFDVNDVHETTVNQLFKYLSLPLDKQGIQQRYREALQSKRKILSIQ